MSYKQLHNIYTESVANREYQYNKKTLLLELTLNDKTIKTFIEKYLWFEFTLNKKDPKQAEYLSGPYVFNEIMFRFCTEHKIGLSAEDVKRKGSDKDRIKTQRIRTVIGRDFSALVGGFDPRWREELKPHNAELADYLIRIIERFGKNNAAVQEILNDLYVIKAGRATIWHFYPWQEDKDIFSIKLRLAYYPELSRFLIEVFNKRQQILPNKDIFAYPSILELCKTLATTRSKAEMSTVSADLEQTIKEIKQAIIPCNNPDWLVIKPPNWEFSKKYFGYTRYSIKRIVEIINRAEKDPANKIQILNEIEDLHKVRGSQWCTTANTDHHWDLYVNTFKSNLYYFISINSNEEEELYAIRTIGAYDNLRAYNAPISTEEMYSIASKMNKIGGTKGEQFLNIREMPKGIPPGVHGVWAVLTPLDNISVLLNHLYYRNLEEFISFATIEHRNQQNSLTPFNVIEMFGEDWVKEHIDFITGIPTMYEENTNKAALDICNKKKADSNKANEANLLKRFKL